MADPNALLFINEYNLEQSGTKLYVRVNPSDKVGFASLPVDPTLLAYQANMYQYVVNSYLKNVPSAQGYGVTVWGVDDPESWIILSRNKQDAPLLFDKNFAKKPAYSGLLQGLKSK